MKLQTLYLAGPDVFYPVPNEIGQRKKRLCEQYGFVGLFPLDNCVDATLAPQAMSQAIYQGNIQLLQQADAILANITPFRGPNMDPGTAFEIGYGCALGKPVFLYSNDARSYRDRVDPLRDSDCEGHSIENFGDVENLMIVRAATLPPQLAEHLSGRDYYESTSSFEAILQRIRHWVDGASNQAG